MANMTMICPLLASCSARSSTGGNAAYLFGITQLPAVQLVFIASPRNRLPKRTACCRYVKQRMVEVALTVKDQETPAPTTLSASIETGVQTRLAVTLISPTPFGVVHPVSAAMLITESAGSPWALTTAVIPAVSVGLRDP